MGKEKLLELIDFSREGKIPVVVIDQADKQVLMLATMDRAALVNTLETGKMHYFSVSKGKQWLKGEQSGNFQLVKEIYVDCDPVNRLLITVEQQGGAACHTGYRTCFHRRVGEDGELVIEGERIFDPDQVYKAADD
jgi:phosphoribosyl-AMP cyclohydrolase